MRSPNRVFDYNGFWLHQRSDTPNWHIYWCKPGTRRVRRKSTNTSNLEKAKQRLVAFSHEHAKPRDREQESVPILEALNEYVEYTLKGKNSQYNARGVLAHFNEFFEIAEVNFVADLTLDVQDQYVAWRKECLTFLGYTASNGTIQRELTTLKAALRSYWKRRYLTSVPYIRSLPSPPSRQRYLSQDEYHLLLSECREPHLRLFVLMAAHTMQRPGAILGLNIQQVDLSRGTINFLPPGAIQTRKRKPVVKITRTLYPLIKAAVEDSCSGFVIEHKGVPLKSVRTSFNKARDRAGLGRDVVPYVLRHTGATLAAAAGVPLRELAGMLGHSSTDTTELYAKHSPEFMGRLTETLDQVFQDPLQTLGPRARCAPNGSYPQVIEIAERKAG